MSERQIDEVRRFKNSSQTHVSLSYGHKEVVTYMQIHHFQALTPYGSTRLSVYIMGNILMNRLDA